MAISGETTRETMMALLGAFPSIKSFKQFKKKDKDIAKCAIPQIIQHAYKQGVLETKSEEEFLKFLQNHEKQNTGMPPENLTFEDVIEEIVQRKHTAVNSLISWLNIIAKEWGMPMISPPMITRSGSSVLTKPPIAWPKRRPASWKMATA